MPETIFRFDLDKTYLKTDFETLKGLIKTAFEKPENKQSFPGADVLLKEIQKNEENTIYFISGSPEQMRRKLEKKLNIDGVKWSQLVLKPNLRNLLLGRFHALKEQVGYKLPVLLESRGRLKLPVREVLFGDDAESDAFVYSLYADVIAGKVGLDVVEKVLELAKAGKEALEKVNKAIKKINFSDGVRRILIHLDKKSPPKRFEKYGSRVVPFYNYFQSAIVLYHDNFIEIGSVLVVMNEMITRGGYSFRVFANSFQDLVRRRVISLKDAVRILKEISEHSINVGLIQDRGFFSDVKELMDAIMDEEGMIESGDMGEKTIDYVKLYVEEHKKAEKKKIGLIDSLLE